MKTIIASAMVMACSALLAGCATHTAKSITVVTERTSLSPDADGNVEVNMQFKIPAGYVPMRSRLIIEPMFVVGDSVIEELPPVVLDGPIYDKKLQRKEIFDGYVDKYSSAVQCLDVDSAYTAEYSETFVLDDKYDTGTLIAIATIDGCGQCHGVDTLQIAGLSNFSTLISTSEMPTTWTEATFEIKPKIFKGKGEARLQFAIDKSDIDMAMANNGEEMDKMLRTLRPVLKDTLSTLNSLRITGSASAEGGYKHNAKLASARATAAKDWIDSQFRLTNKQKKVLKIGSQPEGWLPVVAAMHAAGDKDSVLVKNIALKYPDVTSNEAEKRIRKLDCWPRIAERYLAKDRKVIYEYEWTVRSFTTDDEMLDMYGKRPDAFNEQEFLRVAALAEDDEERMGIYETMLYYFPYSEVAVNNLAILYYKEGSIAAAKHLLERQPALTPEMSSVLAACYAAEGDDESAMAILADVQTADAEYGMGILQARNRQMAEAYEKLGNARDLNAAFVALSLGNDDEAIEILDEIDDRSPRAEYARAIVSARQGDIEQWEKHVKNASVNETLKKRALTEPDFKKVMELKKMSDEK